MTRWPVSFLLTLLLVSFAPAKEPVPPVLVARDATRWPEAPAGMVVPLDSPTSTSFVLFVPSGVAFEPDGATTLTLHFHGAAWFVCQEHARRGARHPLLVGNAKAGDAVFETDIMKPGVVAGLLDQTASTLKTASNRSDVHVGRVELSGFSAGYAGVRGVLRLPEFEPRVARVLLGDSLYVGDGPDSKPPDDRKPRTGADGIDPFVNFARKAAAGERMLLMEHSSTPSMRSVGPMDCSRAVIAALGIPIRKVEKNSISAARETADFQLLWRADAGNAHFWCYHAEERPIHLAHLRNQADMWMALEGRTRTAPPPPPMPPRPIKPDDLSSSETFRLDPGMEGTTTLFLPLNYTVPKNGAVELTLHFHGATWFVIQEHQRHGLGTPLVVLELGQGSTVYRRPFEDPARFDHLLDTVVQELRKQRGAADNAHVAAVNITSFSAGYGAVREIVKSEKHRTLIRRIILADSSYGSLDETALKEGKRVVAPEHVRPWADFARLALTGRKTLLMVTSEIAPETYAGTHEVARAVAESLGLQVEDVAPECCPAAAADQRYPLGARVDAGSFHWWGYRGEDAVAHMTLARHVADLWMTLDQYGDP